MEFCQKAEEYHSFCSYIAQSLHLCDIVVIHCVEGKPRVTVQRELCRPSEYIKGV